MEAYERMEKARYDIFSYFNVPCGHMTKDIYCFDKLFWSVEYGYLYNHNRESYMKNGIKKSVITKWDICLDNEGKPLIFKGAEYTLFIVPDTVNGREIKDSVILYNSMEVVMGTEGNSKTRKTDKLKEE